MPLMIQNPHNIVMPQNESHTPPIWNSSTGQFVISQNESHTPPIWNSPTKKLVETTNDVEIEEVPIYPLMNINTYKNIHKPKVQPLQKLTRQKNTRHRMIPPHMIPQTYNNPTINSYIYMGILYNYSVRLFKKSKSLHGHLDKLLDRYKQLQHIDIPMPYLEKQDNIIHKIFINTINNQIKKIQNIKYTHEEGTYKVLLKVEFNKEIHNDIKELSMLSNKINKQNVHSYIKKFDVFNEKYFTDGIIEMLDLLYVNNENNNKHDTIGAVKADLFKINENIRTKYKPTLSQPTPKPLTQATAKRIAAKNNETKRIAANAKRKKTKRTAIKRAKLFKAVLGQSINSL